MKTLILLAIALAGCAAPPKAEPVKPSRIITHQPTLEVPYKWTEERLIQNSAHDTLIDGDKVIPGVPEAEPSVVLNGVALK